MEETPVENIKSHHRFSQIIFLSSILLLLVFCKCNNTKQIETVTQEKKLEYYSIEGFALGTSYHIKYEGENNLKTIIDSLLNEFENSLSTFRENSVISKINRNDNSVILDNYFINCFNTSMEISKLTNGAFDITVAPLVNVWGFGFEKQEEVNKDIIDSILDFVSYKKINIKNNIIIKNDKRIKLDASAIAKGQSVDVISEYFLNIGINNFLVEIGGELRASGTKQNKINWKIGIDKPIDNSNELDRQIQAKLKVYNKAIATSGNYRQFYVKNGIRYSHTINPHNGYPVKHNLLSVTVMANSCITADAYATAFMVLGYEKSKKIADANNNIDAYFVCSNSENSFNISYTKGFNDVLTD